MLAMEVLSDGSEELASAFSRHAQAGEKRVNVKWRIIQVYSNAVLSSSYCLLHWYYRTRSTLLVVD